MEKILLGEAISNVDSNTENVIGVNLESDVSMLPPDSLRSSLDSYEQYYKEKDESTKYRFTFTISPLCSNVLFNMVSEVVYREGDDSNAIFFGSDSVIPQNTVIPDKIRDYAIYKGYSGSTLSTKLNKAEMIRDTGYSHEEAGGVEYHCGYDIFNNHTLRAKEFHVINKLSENDSTHRSNFNTISDYSRDKDGNLIENTRALISGDTVSSANTFNEHVYMYDTVYRFPESIERNLVEKDGWFGFINPCIIPIPNYVSGGTEVSLNKCMNNNKAGEFIDMYPDRTLFSFVPKYNEYLNRREDNWYLCLTFPYANFYNNTLVQETIYPSDIYQVFVNGVEVEEQFTENGLRAVSLDKLFPNSTQNVIDDGEYVTLRTDVNHGFAVGDDIFLTIIYKNTDVCEVYDVDSRINVFSIGSVDGDEKHYFAIRYSEINRFISVLRDKYFSSDSNIESNVYFRCSKSVNGKKSSYYFRVFKKVPNFNRTNIYNGQYVSDSEIEQYSVTGFDYSVAKMAFERTIYNDNKAQVIFNEDVDLRCLRDNLGFPLSEVYLTVVKKNVGHDQWYGNNSMSVRNSLVEYSHCFGNLTSGLDLPEYVSDFNVHKIHNVKKLSTIPPVNESPNNLEMNLWYIDSEGDGYLQGTYGHGAFLGDLVEFSEETLDENILEDVFFRFNTAQREYTGNLSGFTSMCYDDIDSDDYDLSGHFVSSAYTYNEIKYVDIEGNVTSAETYSINVNPEGYYYKAHYPVHVRKLSPTVNSGEHIRLNYTIESVNGYFITFHTDKNYNIQAGDKLLLYRKDDSHKTYTIAALQVSGENYDHITILLNSSIINSTYTIENYQIYKKNPLEPDSAYELNDGTGRYRWREIEKEKNLTTDDEVYDSVFTNGALYFHKNINFFLKRQDPNGVYGLKFGNGCPTKIRDLVIDGDYKDMENKEYKTTDTVTQC